MDSILKKVILDRIYCIIRILFSKLAGRKLGIPIAFGEEKETSLGAVFHDCNLIS
jgi:hypothetical protein